MGHPTEEREMPESCAVSSQLSSDLHFLSSCFCIYDWNEEIYTSANTDMYRTRYMTRNVQNQGHFCAGQGKVRSGNGSLTVQSIEFLFG